MECKHLSTNLNTSLDNTLFNPSKWSCSQCGTTECVYVCLSCFEVYCGRYIKEHALKHFQRTKHPVAMDVNEGFVFCYECDDYVINDTVSGDLRTIRDILSVISGQNFNRSELARPGLRSMSSNSLKSEDLQYVVVKHRRISIMSKVFTAWRDFVASKRHPQKMRSMVPRRSPRKRCVSENVPSPSRTFSESVQKEEKTTLPPPPPEKKMKRELKPIIISRIKEESRENKRGKSEERMPSSTLLEEDKDNALLPPGVTGLRNLGNTCYMNSVIQVLSNLDEFREWFLAFCPIRPVFDSSPLLQRPDFQRQTTSDCLKRVSLRRSSSAMNVQEEEEESTEASTSKNPVSVSGSSGSTLSEEIYALLRVMWSGKLSLIIPQGFLQAVWNAVPSFKGYRQQDAQEFLCEVLDKLADELGSSEESEAAHKEQQKKAEKKRRLSQSHSMTDLGSMDSIGVGTQAMTDFVRSLFAGELKSEVRCLKCGTKSVRVESFSDLSLEFPSEYQDSKMTNLNLANMICPLTRMLGAFTTTENLGQVYSCDVCAERSEVGDTTSEEEAPSTRRRSGRYRQTPRTEAEKRILVNKLPGLLRLHLKRFRWSDRNHRDKISTHVQYSETLDMAPYCVQKTDTVDSSDLVGLPQSNLPHKSTLYRLCGVIMHHGRGFNSGHYTSYCWNSRGQFWMHCNDARLELCSVEDVLDAQAYILFYRKVDGDSGLNRSSLVSEPKSPFLVPATPRNRIIVRSECDNEDKRTTRSASSQK